MKLFAQLDQDKKMNLKEKCLSLITQCPFHPIQIKNLLFFSNLGQKDL